jgi:capsular exopolysaccharide synthesis family protein
MTRLVAAARRYWWLIALTTAAVLFSALGASLAQTPAYRATANVLVPGSAARGRAAEIRTIRSRAVRSAVAAQLGSAPSVSIAPQGRSDVISISVEARDRRSAAAAANAYAQAYLDRRSDSAAHQIGTARGHGPVRPHTVRSVLLGLLAGLALGTAVAVGVDIRNDWAEHADAYRQAPRRREPPRREPERSRGHAVEADAPERDEPSGPKVAVVGLVPSVSRWRNGAEPALLPRDEPNSPAAEAYRALRATIEAAGRADPFRSIVVTSQRKGTGTTTVAANLAAVMARAGQHVVLVDGDLRRPTAHQLFGLPDDAGFISVLRGEAPLSRALQEVPGEPRLHLLPSGPTSDDPLEVMTPERTLEVLTALLVQAEAVVVDTPNALDHAETAVLAGQADGVLLVATPGEDPSRAAALFEQVGTPLLGMVLNQVQGHDADVTGPAPQAETARFRIG